MGCMVHIRGKGFSVDCPWDLPLLMLRYGLFLLFPEGIGWDCCVFFASLREKDERDYDGHGISSVVGVQLSRFHNH